MEKDETEGGQRTGGCQKSNRGYETRTTALGEGIKPAEKDKELVQ